MTIDISQAMVARLAELTPDEQRAWLKKCGAANVLILDANFEAWHNDGQKPPRTEGWRTWLMMAGRGFGKTRAGAEWIHRLAMQPGKRIALVGATIDEARAVMVEGVSGLIAVAGHYGVKLKWEPSRGVLRWPSGSEAQLYSGENPDGLRGPEHHFAWCDELAKWRRGREAWDNLEMTLRAGPRPRALVTTTPRPIALLEELRARPWTVTTTGRTSDNLSLPDAFLDVMMATYGGTRLGRQELDGEYFSEVEGSLFPRGLIEGARVTPLTLPPLRGGSFDRSRGQTLPQGERGWDKVVVGVDPPAGVDGDACGIVVAGRRDGKCFVLADASVRGLQPEGWARAVAGAAREWGACLVVAEANQGGAMVKSVLLAADAGLAVRLVHASSGKAARAEPVATRMAVGKTFLAGMFPELEAELAGLSAGGRYEGPGRSPDRADAMVWALTELGETRSGVPRVRML